MATTGTENTAAKEKRVTSPSTLRKPADPANRRRSPKNPLDKTQSTKPESSGKQVPNYLKPTLSSRVDQSSSANPTTTKRAPSSSKVQKPVLFSSFREKTSPVHPHQVPKKPATSKKPISGKPVTKTVYRVVKPQPNKTIKDTATTTNDVSLIHNAEKLPEQDFDEKEESLMGDAEEELVKVESGVELFPPESKDLIDTSSDTDPKTQENDENLNDISIVSEDEKNIIPNPNEDNQEIINVNHHVEEETAQIKEDIENTTPEMAEEPKEETEIINKEGEEEHSKSEEGETKGEEKVVEEAKKETENVQAVKLTQAQSANKKGNSPSYNTVIEETTSKLMEKKNKVRAMAGAFETVIALQD